MNWRGIRKRSYLSFRGSVSALVAGIFLSTSLIPPAVLAQHSQHTLQSTLRQASTRHDGQTAGLLQADLQAQRSTEEILAERFHLAIGRTYKALLTDVDDTWTVTGRVVPEAAVTQIVGLLQNRIPVGLITARSLAGDVFGGGAQLIVVRDQVIAELERQGLTTPDAQAPALRYLYLLPENGSYLVRGDEPSEIVDFGLAQVGDLQAFQQVFDPFIEQLREQLGLPDLSDNYGPKRHTVTWRDLPDERIDEIREALDTLIETQGWDFELTQSRGSLEFVPRGGGKGFAFGKFVEQVRQDHPELSLEPEQVVTLGDKGQSTGVDFGMLDRPGGFSVDEFEVESEESATVPTLGLLGWPASRVLVNMVSFTQTQRPAPKILTFGGPSGSGKTTFSRWLIDQDPGQFVRLTRTTTRPARQGEPEGEHRIVSEAEFDAELSSGELLFVRTNYGFRYGFSRRDLEEAMATGKTLVTDAYYSALAMQRAWPQAQLRKVAVVPALVEDSWTTEERQQLQEALQRRIVSRDPEIALDEAVTRSAAQLDEIVRLPASANLVLENREMPDGIPEATLFDELTTFVQHDGDERLDVLSPAGYEVGAAVDRAVAHREGLWHRTSNAVILTPAGDVVLQQRAPHRSYGKHLSIYGGHAGLGDDARTTIEKELKEELGLSDLRGAWFTIGEEDTPYDGTTNQLDGSLTKEFRSLYVYVLTDDEAVHVEQDQLRLEEEREKRGDEGYAAWLKRHPAGQGEVWGVHTLPLAGLLQAPKDAGGKIRFSVGETGSQELAHVTSDLLQPLLEDEAARRRLAFIEYQSRVSRYWPLARSAIDRAEGITQEQLDRAEVALKFDASGAPQPFSGVTTTLDWLTASSPLFGQLEAFQAEVKRELERAGLLDRFSFVPAETFHVTLHDLRAASGDALPDGVEERVAQGTREAFQEIGNAPPVNLEARGLMMFPNLQHALLVPLYPATEDDLAVLDQARREIRDATNVRLPFPFAAHVTLAYVVGPLDADEARRYVEIVDAVQQRTFTQWQANRIELRRFSNMVDYGASPLAAHDWTTASPVDEAQQARELRASDYADPYAAVTALFERQRAAGHFEGDDWKGFFQIVEDGTTVEYGVFLPGQDEPVLYRGEVPAEVLERAEFVFIQNVGRARRPAASGIGQPRVSDDDPAAKVILAEFVREQIPDEVWLQWFGPSDHPWWFLNNPFPIWPPREDAAATDQPHALVVTRADGRVSQREMSATENIGDLVSLLVNMNSSEALQDRLRFRLGINGWYYSDDDAAPKAGASQSQAHGQLVRFPFPIERAPVTWQMDIGPVRVSTLDDGRGTGLVLDAPVEAKDELVRVAVSAVGMITAKGHTFNALATFEADERIRIFIADRPLGVPDPHFTNEWGFAEFGRAVVVDGPTTFYQVDDDASALAAFADVPRQEQAAWTRAQREEGGIFRTVSAALRDEAVESLRLVTAPQGEIDEIVDRLGATLGGATSGPIRVRGGVPGGRGAPVAITKLAADGSLWDRPESVPPVSWDLFEQAMQRFVENCRQCEWVDGLPLLFVQGNDRFIHFDESEEDRRLMEDTQRSMLERLIREHLDIPYDPSSTGAQWMVIDDDINTFVRSRLEEMAGEGIDEETVRQALRGDSEGIPAEILERVDIALRGARALIEMEVEHQFYHGALRGTKSQASPGGQLFLMEELAVTFLEVQHFLRYDNQTREAVISLLGRSGNDYDDFRFRTRVLARAHNAARGAEGEGAAAEEAMLAGLSASLRGLIEYVVDPRIYTYPGIEDARQTLRALAQEPEVIREYTSAVQTALNVETVGGIEDLIESLIWEVVREELEQQLALRTMDEVKPTLGDSPLVFVANRSIFEIVREEGRLQVRRGAGGVSPSMDQGLAIEHGGLVYATAMTDLEKMLARRNLLASRLITDDEGGSRPDGSWVRYIDVPPEEYEQFYNLFANPVLWLTQHQMPEHLVSRPAVRDVIENPGAWARYYWPFSESASRIPDDSARLIYTNRVRRGYEGYKSVNQRFGQAITGDLLDVPGFRLGEQDYHFYSLTHYLREAGFEGTVEHFTHIPIPPPVFFDMALPREVSTELVEAWLQNDVVSFHIDAYVRRFMGLAHRLLGAEIDLRRGVVRHNGRETYVVSNPIAPDHDAIRAAGLGPESIAYAAALRRKVGDKVLIGRADRVDWSKGIPMQFFGVERMLDDHPELVGQVQFFGLLQPSRMDVPQYVRLMADVEGLIRRINKKFAPHIEWDGIARDQADVEAMFAREEWPPIVVVIRANPFAHVLGMALADDANVVNPKVDGMNLVAKEVGLMQSLIEQARALMALEHPDEAARLQPAVMVATRNMGAIQEIEERGESPSVLMIEDADDVEETAGTLYRAVTIAQQEREGRARLRRDGPYSEWRRMAVERELPATRLARVYAAQAGWGDLRRWIRQFLADLRLRNPGVDQQIRRIGLDRVRQQLYLEQVQEEAVAAGEASGFAQPSESVQRAIPLLPGGGGLPVLSLGSGVGADELLMIEHDPTLRVIGTGRNLEDVTSARRNAQLVGAGDRLRFRVGDIRDGLADRDGSIGFIYALLSFDDLSQQEFANALAEMHRAASDGARIQLVVRSDHDYGIRLTEADTAYWTQLTTYQTADGRMVSHQFFSAQRLGQLVEAAGFSVDSVDEHQERLFVDAARTIPEQHISSLMTIIATKPGVPQTAGPGENVDRAGATLGGATVEDDGTTPSPMPDVVGLVGVGGFGERILQNLLKMTEGTPTRVRAVAGRNVEQVRSTYGAHKQLTVESRDAETVTADDTVRNVIIATQAVTHYETVRQHLEAGKDVYVEKPFTVNAEQARDLVALAKARGRILMVGHILLYAPAFQRLKAMVDRGDLGRIQRIEASFLTPWREDVERSSTVVEDLAYHDVYMINALLGEDPSVEIVSATQSSTGETADLRLRYGAVEVGIHVSREHEGDPTRTLEVIGTEGTATFDHLENRLRVGDAVEDVEDEPLEPELRAFFRAIHTRVDPPSSGEAAVPTVELIERISHTLQEPADRAGATLGGAITMPVPLSLELLDQLRTRSHTLQHP